MSSRLAWPVLIMLGAAAFLAMLWGRSLENEISSLLARVAAVCLAVYVLIVTFKKAQAADEGKK